MSELPACPICTMADILEAPESYECLTCGHEWPRSVDDPSEPRVVKDANGNQLFDGDSVTLIKELKLKGGGGSIKIGTKVKSIRLVEGDHEIDCKIGGQGMMLKAQFVKKA